MWHNRSKPLISTVEAVKIPSHGACGLLGQGDRNHGPLKPNDGGGRQVTRFEPKVKELTYPSECMRQATDSAQGRGLDSQGIGTVEPVFANIRNNKCLTHLNHRGHAKVNTQWHLHCMVHNIEKLSKTKLGRNGEQEGGRTGQ